MIKAKLNIRKIIVYFLLSLIGLYLIAVLAMYSIQRHLMLRPIPLDKDYIFQFDQPFKEYYLPAKDGSSINALHFLSEGVQRGVVLYFHGNADNLQRWGQYAIDFTQRGYDVLMIDYRSFGKSKGKVSEEAFYQDAKMAYQWLRQRFMPEEIIIYGRSLGAAVAAQLATQVPARMLLLETPFDRMLTAVKHRIPSLFLPFPLSYQFPNDEFIPQVDYPICIFQGTADDIVPYYSAEKLKPLLKPSDEFITIENGRHKNLRTFAVYQTVLERLLGLDEFEGE